MTSSALSTVRATLVAEGSSDDALLPILRWLARRSGVVLDVARPSLDIPRPPRTLEEKARVALQLRNAPLLFVHRDADNAGRGPRVAEIRAAVAAVGVSHVAVVPVRMTEAWLLFDEVALRKAANNPSGTVRLELPARRRIEAIPNPKNLLHQLLTTATEASAGRLRRFRVHQAVSNLAELIDDFSPLDELDAFAALQQELTAALQAIKDAPDP